MSDIFDVSKLTPLRADLLEAIGQNAPVQTPPQNLGVPFVQNTQTTQPTQTIPNPLTAYETIPVTTTGPVINTTLRTEYQGELITLPDVPPTGEIYDARTLTQPTLRIPTTPVQHTVQLPGTIENGPINGPITSPGPIPLIGVPILSPLPVPTVPTTDLPTFPVLSPLPAPPINITPPETCCICYDEEIPSTDLLNCKHPVCGECIGQLQKAECPFCREALEGPLVTDAALANILNREEQARLAEINANYMAGLYLQENPEADPEEVYRMYRQ